ncbi:MAG: hypothetical protein QM767_27350 [Anaeromyxobacter sp.]
MAAVTSNGPSHVWPQSVERWTESVWTGTGVAGRYSFTVSRIEK